MNRIFAITLTLFIFAASSVSAQMMTLSQEQLSLPIVQDCPIEKPFSPKPETSETNSEGTTIVYPLDGYLFHRIEFQGLQAPADLEITWVPRDNSQRPATKSAQISVKSSDECRVSWFFAPNDVPTKQIEVRSKAPITGLTLSFSQRNWDHEGSCSAKELCPKLIGLGKQCRNLNDAKSCGSFLKVFKRLTEVEQCRRSYDFSPVPSIWACDELLQAQIMKDSIDMLKKMSKRGNTKAAEFYKSQQFKGVLDGAFLEDYMSGR